MQERYEELQARGAQALVISFSPAERLEAFKAHLGLSFEIASDPTHQVYSAYGMLTGGAWDIWHPRTLLRYLVLVLKEGRRLSRPSDEDLEQLGGDFIIDPQGRVRYAYRSQRPDDRPSVEALLSALPRD